MTPRGSSTSRRIWIALGVWLALVLALGASGALAAPRRPPPQALLFALVTALLLATWRSRGLREWLRSVPLDGLVAFHLTRFVGIYFLVLHARGELPWAFAVPGGWGDIAVASGAVALLLLRGISRPAPEPIYLAWNVAGLIDILFVVATAVRLVLAEPASMAALTRLPLSLLPTFVVPLILFTHLVIGYRLLARRG